MLRIRLIFFFLIIFRFGAFCQNSFIKEMVQATNRDSLLSYVTHLQNFGTRYEFTPTRDSAASYILKEFIRWGLQAESDSFVIGKYPFFDADIISNDSIWAIGNNNMVCFSLNGGNTWNVQTTPLSANNELYGIDMISGFNGFIVGRAGTVLHTINGGLVWQLQTPITTQNLNTVHFGNSNTGIIAGGNGVIMRTNNGGDSWNIVVSGTTALFTDAKYVTPNTAFIVGDSGYILKSTNGGLSWSKKNSNINSCLYSIYFIDSINGFACGDESTVLKTIDGGETWNKLPFTNETIKRIRSVMFFDEQNGIVISASGELYATGNGGLKWQIRENLIENLWYPPFFKIKGNPNRKIIITGGGATLLSSSDNALIWNSISKKLPEQFNHSTRNIIAIIPGTITPEKECVLVAHYDCHSPTPMLAAPGANDNGTGTAAIMEAARILRNYKFQSTIKIVAVSGEEVGLHGSKRYAYLAKKQSKNIPLALNGDMLGFPINGDTTHLTVTSYLNPIKWLDSAILYNQRYNIGLNLIKGIDNTGASDHSPFTVAGFDALFFSEATATDIWGGGDPYYHTLNDSASKLNFGLVQKAARIMIATVSEVVGTSGRNLWVLPSNKRNGDGVALYNAFPNPVFKSVTFSFYLPFKSPVKLLIQNNRGRIVQTLVSKTLSNGYYEMDFDLSNHTTGVYYYQLVAGTYIDTKKIIISR
jgi:photosystem II stability/assembly factor-like uncharacterized protein